MKTARTLMILFLFLGLALPAQAFQRGGPGKGRNFKKFKKMRTKMLREKIGLTDDEIKKVEAIMDEEAGERKRIHRQLRDAKTALKDLIEDDSTDQAAFKKNLDTLLAAKTAMHELHMKHIAKIREILTPKKATRLLTAMERMHKRMRGHRGKKGHHRGPGGPGFDGPDKTEDFPPKEDPPANF